MFLNCYRFKNNEEKKIWGGEMANKKCGREKKYMEQGSNA